MVRVWVGWGCEFGEIKREGLERVFGGAGGGWRGRERRFLRVGQRSVGGGEELEGWDTVK